jgi:glutamine amidotransferase
VSSTVALIDYGAGNLQSVRNALKAAGAANVLVTADPDVAAKADRIVLPGVGAFAHCMQALSAIDGMVEALDSATGEGGRPFLGICVGMQLMAEAGEEHGRHAGLGWVKGTVRLLQGHDTIKIPHMGWNDVVPIGDHPLISAGEAYFLHSFAFEGEGVLATSDHGGPLTAAIGVGNRIGVQFHPEKSQRYGLEFLARFLEWTP